MAEFSYDVVPHGGGWVILLSPAEDEAFGTKQAAFDAAADLARKLRFAGHSLSVRVFATADRTRFDKAS